MQTRVVPSLVAASLVLAGIPPAAAAGPEAEQRLQDTGLYTDGPGLVVRPENLPFSPQYPLWSDGAVKRRWIALPPGSAIDASRPEAWDFPRGTRLWKEFSVDGQRVETRLIERLADGEWRYSSYVWSADGSEAWLAPARGIPALLVAGGGRYAIPSEPDCRACHEGAAVPVLGFSALQLSADRDPLAPHAEPRRPGEPDLRELVELGWLTGLPPALLVTPPRVAAPTPAGRAVLGYLHGNCGHCHSDPADSLAAVPVALQLAWDPHGDDDSGLRALLDATPRSRMPGAAGSRLLLPGDAAGSLLLLRMRSRDPRTQMPPLGTSTPDAAALALIERWVNHDLPDLKEYSP